MSGESYTVKERIEQLATTIAAQFVGIVNQLDTIERKIDEKASNARVDAIEKQLDRRWDESDKRIVRLELGAAGSAAVSTFQRWLLGTVVALSATGASILIWLVSTGGKP